MEEHTGNSKKFDENNDIVIIYTSINNFNLYIKINYLSEFISMIILAYPNYIVYISILIL